jgi:hypothetical protein
MTKQIINTLLSMFLAVGLYGQNCTNPNFPVALPDSCGTAPFLCGNYLDGYCSSNAGLTGDSVNGIFLEGAGFLRFAGCFTDVTLSAEVQNCANGEGLVFTLLGGDCDSFQVLQSFTVNDNQSLNLSMTGIQPDSVYYLAISGVNNDACDFTLGVVDGIGTTPPAFIQCECTDGSVTGPEDVCPGDMVSYSIIPIDCTLDFLPGAPGNGYYCSPPISDCGNQDPDSIQLIWHIPSFMKFLGDSVDVYSIDVMVLDTFPFTMDTMLMDSVWLEWVVIPNPDTTNMQDSTVFCDCILDGCGGSIGAQPVNMNINFIYDQCTLTCFEPECTINGQTYSQPGTYTEINGCEIRIVEIFEDFSPPFISLSGIGIITCDNPTAEIFADVFPSDASIDWFVNGGFAGSGNTIIVSSGGPVEAIAINNINGCVSQEFFFVDEDTQPPVADAGPDVTICEGESTTLSGAGSSQGSNFIYDWSTGESSLTIEVAPTMTTMYTLEVTNTDNGCIELDQVTVFVEPDEFINMGVVGNVNCDQPCLDYMGQSYCDPGVYLVTQACQSIQFEIGFEKVVQNLGVAGVITCTDPCVSVMGQDYCDAGNYQIEDACYLYEFSIGEDLSMPAYTGLNHDCLPSNTAFRVAFNLDGTPPFKVNGVALNSNYFLSPPIANGTDYAFVVEQSSNGCSVVVSGTYDCTEFCGSQAGDLASVPQDLCHGDPLQVNVVAPSQVANGEGLEYLLYTSVNNMPDALLDRNYTGSFSATNLIPDQTYFIVQAVGPMDLTGAVDLENGCTVLSNPQPFVVHPQPSGFDLDLSMPDCFGESNGSIELVSVATGTGPFESVLNGQTGVGNGTFPDLSSGIYQLEILDGLGCAADTTLVLPDPAELQVTLGQDIETTPGSVVELSAQPSNTNVHIQWTSGLGMENSEGFQWSLTPFESSWYACTIRDEAGCIASDTILVEVKGDYGVYKPNVLKPNASISANQYFTLYDTENYIQRVEMLQVYDRWGALVFEKKNFEPGVPEQGWDGRANGNLAPAGVYQFVARLITYSGEPLVLNGDVTLIR